MKAYLIGLLGIFFILSASCIFSASMWYKFNETWATDGNAILKVFVDTSTDGTANTGVSVAANLALDQNDCDYNATTVAYADGTYANFNLDLNCDGVLDLNGADLTVTMTTTSPALSKDFEFYLPGFRDVDLNWDVGNLTSIIDITTDENIVVAPLYYDENGDLVAGFTGLWKLYLFSPTGVFIDAYDANADNNITIPVTDFNTTPGMYKLLVGNNVEDENTAGYKTFVFNVKSFNLIAYVQNDLDESKGTYGTGESLELVVFATDINNTGVTLSKIYYKTDAGSLTTVSSPLKKNIIALSVLDAGKHSMKVIGTYGDYNQTLNLDFYVTAYAPEFKLKKNSNAGTKEKFAGVYAPSSTVTFLFGINDLTTGQPEDINTDAKCVLLLDKIKYNGAGKKTTTTVSWADNNVSYNSIEKLCELLVTAPPTEGEYLYNLDLNDNYSNDYSGVDLDSKTQKLKVQKYVVFLEPIDVESAINSEGEIDKKAYKFEFFDENIGFVISTIDLSNGSTTDLNVADILTLTVIKSGVSTDFSASDYDYNTNLKFFEIDKDAEAFSSVSGKFEIKAVLDTNSNTGAQIDAYGSASKKTFKISVDLNKDSYGGPPYVIPGENVVLVVTVKNSSKQAVAYASVSLSTIYDVENMEEVNLGSFSAIADASGVAYLDLGSDLNRGMYEITVDVNDGTSTDEGIGFVMVKKFFAFGFPGDYQQDGAVLEFFENAYLGMDENINIATFVFNGTGAGFGGTEFADTSEYSIPPGTAKLFYETDDSAGRKLIYADIVDRNIDANWTKGSVIDPGRMVRITPNVDLTPGFYEAVYDVNWNEEIDTAMAPFVIQGFGLQICNYTNTGVSCGESLMGGGQDIKGAPDSNVRWVINGTSPGDVSLTISLIDMKTFNVVSGGDDLNFYVNGVQKNDVNFNFNSNPRDDNYADDYNIDVFIPAGLDLGDYDLEFDFVIDDIHTMYSRTITIKQFAATVLSDNQGTREIQYINDWLNGGLDINILDTDASNKPSFCGDNNFDVGTIAYDYFYYPGQGDSDFNYSILVDINEPRIYIDLNQDCNFANDDLNVTPNDKSIITELQEDGNAPMITNVTLTGIKYISVPEDIVSANDSQGQNWAGEFDVDRNMVIPLVITDISGNLLPDIMVTINKVKKIDFINKQMETLSTGYTVYNDNNSDANGIVFLKMNIEETGEYQLELIIEDASGNKEKLMPWEGPVFHVKKLSADFGFVRASRYAGTNLSIDINQSPYNNYGIQGDNYEFAGVFSELADDYDLDNDGSKDKNYYFLRDVTYGTYMVDDDYNFNEMIEAFGMRSEGMSTNWPICLGDYNATSGKNDCTVDSIIIASSTTSDLEVNLLEHQGKNWSFEDYNQEDNNSPDGWISSGSPSSPDTYFIVSDANVKTGKKSLLFDGNVEPQLDNPTILYNHQNEDFNFSFWAFATTDTNLKAMAFYYPGGFSDGNYYYNFTTELWDVNIPDVNTDHFFVAQLSNLDWNYLSVDINVGDMTEINFGFVGDFNSDHNFVLDDVRFDGNLTTSVVEFYNRTNYRAPSAAIIADSDLTASDYTMWADSNLADVNHYYEVSFVDRSKADMNIVDANVSALLIKKNTCAQDFGNDSMSLKGKFTGNRIGIIDKWVFNFGNLGAGIGDTNCWKYEIKADISAIVDELAYKDSAWSSFYISNNEGS